MSFVTIRSNPPITISDGCYDTLKMVDGHTVESVQADLDRAQASLPGGMALFLDECLKGSEEQYSKYWVEYASAIYTT